MNRDKVVICELCPKCKEDNFSYRFETKDFRCQSCQWVGKVEEKLEYHALPKEAMEKLLLQDENVGEAIKYMKDYQLDPLRHAEGLIVAMNVMKLLTSNPKGGSDG